MSTENIPQLDLAAVEEQRVLEKRPSFTKKMSKKIKVGRGAGGGRREGRAPLPHGDAPPS